MRRGSRRKHVEARKKENAAGIAVIVPASDSHSLPKARTLDMTKEVYVVTI